MADPDDVSKATGIPRTSRQFDAEGDDDRREPDVFDVMRGLVIVGFAFVVFLPLVRLGAVVAALCGRSGITHIGIAPVRLRRWASPRGE